MQMKHIFTVDVEDWYHGYPPEYLVGHKRTLRLDRGLTLLFEELDRTNTKGTFFWLATQAALYPKLIRECVALGHEIGCHGLNHTPIYWQSREIFHAQIREALKILEDTSFQQIESYRAPFFSVRQDSLWALEILVSLGFKYDASILPMRHWRTGMSNESDLIHEILTPSGNIIEVPVSISNTFGIRHPTAGGGFFRAYPYKFTRRSFSQATDLFKPVVFYTHPWEYDTARPTMPFWSLQTMLNRIHIGSTARKLRSLLEEFCFAPLSEIAAEEIAKQQLKSGKVISPIR